MKLEVVDIATNKAIFQFIEAKSSFKIKKGKL